MRKLIVCNIISLDGFYSGPDGDVMVMPFDAGFSDYNAERLRAADTLLLGRTSYEGFRSYWPTVAEDMSQPAVEREISRLNAAIEKVVVSNSLKPDEIEGWGLTRAVLRADAHAEVAALKRGPGRDILIFGWSARACRRSRSGRPVRSACWTPVPSMARACLWPGTPSSADCLCPLKRTPNNSFKSTPLCGAA